MNNWYLKFIKLAQEEKSPTWQDEFADIKDRFSVAHDMMAEKGHQTFQDPMVTDLTNIDYISEQFLNQHTSEILDKIETLKRSYQNQTNINDEPQEMPDAWIGPYHEEEITYPEARGRLMFNLPLMNYNISINMDMYIDEHPSTFAWNPNNSYFSLAADFTSEPVLSKKAFEGERGGSSIVHIPYTLANEKYIKPYLKNLINGSVHSYINRNSNALQDMLQSKAPDQHIGNLNKNNQMLMNIAWKFNEANTNNCTPEILDGQLDGLQLAAEICEHPYIRKIYNDHINPDDRRESIYVSSLWSLPYSVFVHLVHWMEEFINKNSGPS